MYGLKQASVLAYQHLSKLLNDGGYKQILGSLGMWKHETRDTIFCLCVDDFGVKYFSKEDVQHLHDTIATEYTCKIDWKGENFLGYTIKWDYEKGHVDISMPDYIRNALKNYSTKQKYIFSTPPMSTLLSIGQTKVKDNMLNNLMTLRS